MRLTIVQSSLQWESPDANRLMFAQKLAPLRSHTDLVLLPEMFTTGFSMNTAGLGESMEGPTLHWMRALSNDLNAVVTGSFICKANGQYFNRLVWMRPDGQWEVYDKKHLFGLSNEHVHYTAGQKRLVTEWLGWRICPLICYDLRFPVWSSNVAVSAVSDPQEQVYDLLIYAANWPARRGHHWRSLLTARAIENQSFVAGVNVFGKDGSGLEYTGDSAIIDFAGQTICQISGQEGLFTAELSLSDLRAYRQQLPFLQDGDSFTLN